MDAKRRGHVFIRDLDFGVVRTIVVSWIVTLPVGALLAVVFYHVLTFALARSAG